MKPTLSRILAVDDDQAFVELVRNFFASYGIDVVGAQTGREAVERMKAHPFAVVLLDYRLPLMDGHDVIALLQKINPLARFIVVSGVIEEDVEEKFKGLGYMSFFEKGKLHLQDLLQAVKTALHS